MVDILHRYWNLGLPSITSRTARIKWAGLLRFIPVFLSFMITQRVVSDWLSTASFWFSSVWHADGVNNQHLSSITLVVWPQQRV